MSMRKAPLAGLLMFAFALLSLGLRAQTLTLSYFNASPDGTDVLVSFEVPSEAGVTNFKLWRKIGNEPDYSFLTHMAPTGNMRYTYLDYTIFKDEAKQISYKLQVYQNGAVFTYYTNILHNPTSVQRTWGSIKAMFR
jgi:hypothetical protein